MDNENVIPILSGYGDLGELIELAVRLKRVSEEINWYLHHIEQRITVLMKASQEKV